MESRRRAEGDLAKVRKDKDMLHSSFQQLGSVVHTKDEVIQGLRDRYNSAIRDLSAEKLQLKVERQRLATVNKDLNTARDLERVQGLAIQQFIPCKTN